MKAPFTVLFTLYGRGLFVGFRGNEFGEVKPRFFQKSFELLKFIFV